MVAQFVKVCRRRPTVGEAPRGRGGPRAPRADVPRAQSSRLLLPVPVGLVPDDGPREGPLSAASEGVPGVVHGALVGRRDHQAGQLEGADISRQRQCK